MKLITNFLLTGLILIAFQSSIFGQFFKMDGKGPIVTQTIELDEIHSIGLSVRADLKLTQGDAQSITIKGQQNIIDNILTKVKGKSWSIKFDEKVDEYERLEILVTMRTLEAISLAGSGSIESTKTFTNLDDIAISIAGSGNVDLSVEADDIEISTAGSGEVDLDGSGDNLTISTAGSGAIYAMDCLVNNCEISTAGSGEVECHVEKALKASTIGSGHITYKGNPSIEHSSIGSGKIRKK